MNSGSNVIDLMRPLNNILFNPTNWYQHSCLPNTTLHCIAFHRSQCDCTKIVCCICRFAKYMTIYLFRYETSLARPNPFFFRLPVVIVQFYPPFPLKRIFCVSFSKLLNPRGISPNWWVNGFCLILLRFLSRHNSYI